MHDFRAWNSCPFLRIGFDRATADRLASKSAHQSNVCETFRLAPDLTLTWLTTRLQTYSAACRRSDSWPAPIQGCGWELKMNKLPVLLVLLVTNVAAQAHPGVGIVADSGGNVHFPAL